jgi:choline dehydrogenase-like flavoprotein
MASPDRYDVLGLGFENLYLVDASAIPEIPSANTNLSTVALAERVATWL